MSNPSQLFQIAEIMEAQRSRDQAKLLKECQDQWQSGGSLSKDLLRRVSYTSPEGAKAILDAHPAKKLQDAVENVRTAFEVVRSARDAILAVYGKFHAQVVHNTSGANLEETLLKATREVFTFAFAASALVQAYRHLESTAPRISADLKVLKGEIFNDEPLAAFLQKLRNGFSHTQLFKAEPTYTITHGETRTVSTNLHFNKSALLKEEWSGEARKFIERSDTLDVMEIVSAYFLQAEHFFEAYPSRTGIIHDTLFKDYNRIKQAQEIIRYEMNFGLVFQHIKNKPFDPYRYLSRYLTPEEIARVACFQDHSKEQVDYIISLRDPLGLCAPRTKQGFYRMFGVFLAE